MLVPTNHNERPRYHRGSRDWKWKDLSLRAANAKTCVGLRKIERRGWSDQFDFSPDEGTGSLDLEHNKNILQVDGAERRLYLWGRGDIRATF